MAQRAVVEALHRWNFKIDRTTSLTPREEDVFVCLLHGLHDKEICNQLGIASASVHSHVENLLHKLGAHSRREAVQRFLAPRFPFNLTARTAYPNVASWARRN